jgi:hypothetical protein
MRLYTEISFNDFGIFLYSINMNSTRVFLKTQEYNGYLYVGTRHAVSLRKYKISMENDK